MNKKFVLILISTLLFSFLASIDPVFSHEPLELNLVKINNRCIRACKARFSAESARYPMDESCEQGCQWSHKYILEKVGDKPFEPVHQENVLITY